MTAMECMGSGLKESIKVAMSLPVASVNWHQDVVVPVFIFLHSINRWSRHSWPTTDPQPSSSPSSQSITAWLGVFLRYQSASKRHNREIKIMIIVS